MYAFLGAWWILNLILSVILIIVLNHRFPTKASEKRVFLYYGIILLFHPVLLSIMGILLIILSQHDEKGKIKDEEGRK